MSGSPAPALAGALIDAAATRHHRHLLLLCGTPGWCRDIAAEIVTGAPRLWIATRASDGGAAVPHARARTVLGGETRLVVYDAHEGLDPDALAAATGTLRGGGLLLLLAPPLDAWAGRPDPTLARFLSAPATPADATGRFVARLVATLDGDPAVTVWRQGGPLPATPAGTPPPQHPAPRADADGCLGEDQRRAVAAVLATAADATPCVLIADRGRGKSAALGLAAAALLSAGARRIVVTAPRRAAAAALFRHAATRLALPAADGDLRLANGGTLGFVAPDRLAQAPRGADLVLVDEAAAIPSPLLETLLHHNRRIAFATTVHGYEGTGRGFAVRFRATLDRLAPGWRETTLQAPIRWAADDPLEAWLNTALLLDAEPPPLIPEMGVMRCSRLDRDRLLADEPLLRALFGLLVQAHYRTTPADLRQLLDAPGTTLLAAHIGDALAGVAVCVDEGRLDPDTAFAVWAGRRRVRGHLVAQSLAGHAGLRQAASAGYRRVQRLAVHPTARRRGLGRALVDAVVSSARAEGFDLVATSFGMAPELLDFWHACGLTPARVGLRREAASGAHALMMLRPLTPTGMELATTARSRLGRALPSLLHGPLADLEAPLVERLRAQLPHAEADLPAGADDWEEAIAFAFAARGPDAAFAALRRVTLELLGGADTLPATLGDALRARFVDAESWPQVAGRLGCAGRKSAVERLREGLRTVLRARNDPALAALIARLDGARGPRTGRR